MELKKRLSILIYPILIFTVSCASKPTAEFKEIRHEKVEVLDYTTFCPSFVLYLKNHLLLINNSHDTIFELVNLNTFASKKFGAKGKGPKEFLYISDAYNDYSSNSVVLVDGHLKKVLRIPYETILTGDISMVEELKLPSSISFYTEVELTESGWVFGNLKGNSMITNIDSTGKEHHFDYQPKTSLALSPNTKPYAYYSALSYCSARNKTVVGLRYFPYIFILNDKAELEKVIVTRKDFSEPLFEHESTVSHANTMIYCWEVHATDKYIYAVNAGVTQGDFENDNLKGTEILTFDWDGNPISKVFTDFAFGNLTFDFENAYIYGNSNKDMYRCISRIPLVAK